MNRIHWKATGLALLICVGCAASSSHPEPSPPPQPQEVTGEELSTIREYMWALAGEVRALDEELSFGDETDADRYAVASHLERILAIATDLDQDNTQIQHPVISESLERFTHEVRFALDSTRESEDGFVNAGKVIGACSACHDVRACPFDSYSRCIETD